MTDEGVVSEEIILRARTFFGAALIAGYDQQLNEIAEVIAHIKRSDTIL